MMRLKRLLKKPPVTKRSNMQKLLSHSQRHEKFLEREGPITSRIISRWVHQYKTIQEETKPSKYTLMLDKLIENSPATTEAFIVYRGIRVANDNEFRAHTKSFLAVSRDQDVAENFLYGAPGLVLEILIPKGTHILDLGEETVENELLLPRGTCLFITSMNESCAQATLLPCVN